ncbi:MAG: cell wall hydrolase [Clostridia bacterium]|nr:cell wall hydrolase [Clostridia bacterium]
MKYLLKFQFKPILAYFLCLALTVTGMLYVPSVSYAASTQEKLDETNEKLDELRENHDILTSDLDELNTKLDNAANELTDIQSQISQKEEEITQLEKEITKAIEYEEAQYESMKLRIKYMYENGSSTSSIALLLEAGNMEEFLTRAEYISKISAYDRQMLEEYHENYLTLVNARVKIQEEKSNLVALSRDAESHQNEIRQLVNDTQEKIDTSSDEIKKAEELALQYEQQIQAEIIARQEAERKAAEEAARKAAEEAARQNAQGGNTNFNGLDLLHQQTLHNKINYTPEELAMLAAIIECEAANQPYEGKLAVGSVVINRMNNPRWPSTMTEVLYQPNQFTPVKSGRFAIVLARGANASCTQAALQVLNGGSTIDAIYFHVVREGETGGTVIADHIFF